MSETDHTTAADTAPAPGQLAIKTFPITVPIMGSGALALFRPPPQESMSDESWIHGLFPVQYSQTRLEELAEALENARLPGPHWYRLLEEGERLSLSPGSTELLTPRHLAEVWRRVGVIPYPHQLETARRVLFEMGGRAILADEVGLGKTIEAGLIIKECLLRQTARKVLILTPAGLVWQWFRELKEKFNLSCGMQRSEYDWERTDLLIASIDTAKRSPHREIIQRLHYDILVVDEAHKLKNATTQNYKFINSIRRKHCLMLTATPVQNDLKELYNLINLVRPGQLGTYRQFKQAFVEDQRTPKGTKELKRLLSQVLVRNRRGRGTVQFTARRGSRDARRSLAVGTRSIRRRHRRRQGGVSPGSRRLPKRPAPHYPTAGGVLQSIAAAVTLEKLLMRTSRSRRALPLARAPLPRPRDDDQQQGGYCSNISSLGLGDEKVIVFTEYRATQQYLRWRLEPPAFSTLGFDGSLSTSRKEWIGNSLAPGASVGEHGVWRRGDQLPVLLPRRQLRSPVESDAPRAADRAGPPARPNPGRLDLQLRHPGHG